MNYISEINLFYDWIETNPLSDSAIALWHALMHVNNKCGWKQEFSVSISTIQNKTGMSKPSVERARKRLADAGRIKFTSRNGRQSALYTIVVLQGDAQSVAQNVVQTDTYDTPDNVVRHIDAQSDSQTVVQSVAQQDFARHIDAQSVAILKLNNINKKEAEPFFHIGTQLIKGKPSDRIKSDHSMATDNFMITIFRGLDKNKILERLDAEYLGYEFKDEMHLRNTFKSLGEKMIKDAKPRTTYPKQDTPAAGNEGFTSLQKPRGAVSHGK